MWRSEIEFVNDEHHQIFDQTKDIPGWQAVGDTQRLYEMAYKAGDVILEIGTFGGRSATVELRGALANTERKSPMYFGVDVEISSVWRTLKNLNEQQLLQHSLVMLGNLKKFVTEFQIQPTMVFVDGDHSYEGVQSDLSLLKNYLVPHTPVLCHDYGNSRNDTGEMGVQRAVDEFVAAGNAELIGRDGCSALLLTTAACTGKPCEKWSEQQFAERRAELHWQYTHRLYQANHKLANELARLKDTDQLDRKLDAA